MLLELFKNMPASNATDLHLSPGQPAMYRVFGEIQKIQTEVFESEKILEMAKGILNEDQKAHFDENWDLDFCYHMEGVGRFRSNLMKTRLGFGLVARYLPETIPTIEQLGLSNTIIELTHHHQGLVLVTGPIRTGKTTTIASLIQAINAKEADHIITIEDPIEYIFPKGEALVNQRDISLHTLSTAAAMRAALREDPDIIFVGEMRDLETMHLAIEAAETGHLVFSTLQTKSAHKTIDRILDSFPPKQIAQIQTLLAGSLKGVIAQQLVKKADGSGMTLATEVLLGNASLSNMIREGKTFQIPSLMQIGRAHGMITMEESLLTLYKAGTITFEEAASKSADPRLFRSKHGKTAATETNAPGAPAGGKPAPGAKPGATAPAGKNPDIKVTTVFKEQK
jgi:twitching motility protein PilT